MSGKARISNAFTNKIKIFGEQASSRALNNNVVKATMGAGQKGVNYVNDGFKAFEQGARRYVERSRGTMLHKGSKHGPNMMMKQGGLGVGSKLLMTGGLAVGALAYTAHGIMSGSVDRINETVMQRYLRDQKNVNNLTYRTRVGRSTGARSMTVGNHSGLSLSLHKSRHG